MRLLVFADIHNNIAAVRSLRTQEMNEYDAIIVAGDIGNRIAIDFRQVMDTFGCPVFYVYGNWDDEQEYKQPTSLNCKLLHLSIEKCAGYFFTGFSGCTSKWGKNPHYLAASREARIKYHEKESEIHVAHKCTLNLLDDIQKEMSEKMHDAEAEFKNRGKLLLARKAKVGDKAHRKAREGLHLWYAKRRTSIEKLESKFKSSKEYEAYQQTLWAAARE